MTNKNKQLVDRALNELFQERNLEAIDRYFASDYRQHNPFVANGPDGLRAFVSQAIVPNPNFGARASHLLGDGEFVAVRSRYTGLGPRAFVGFDLFRIRDGAIAEHWDCLQEDSNDQAHFDAAAPEIGAGEVELNRKLVGDFVDRVLIGKGFDLAPDLVADGATVPSLRETCSEKSTRRYTRLHRVVADGDVVLTQAEGTVEGRPHALYDLFQVRDGRIVAHWGVVQEVTAVDTSGLGMF